MQTISLPLESLLPYAGNPRRNDHAVEQVAAAIKRFGFRVPVLAKSDGSIIDGHLRVKAAKRLGMAEVPVVLCDDLSDSEIKALRISINRMAELAEWDEELLMAELEGLAAEGVTMEDVGFDLDALEELGASLEQEPNTDLDAEPQIDKAEELLVKWGVEPGQLWELGDHRLLCGDSRKKENVEGVLEGEKINLAFTSPPYASQRTYDELSGFKPIHPDKFVEWFQPIAVNVKSNLASDGSWFVNIKPACEGLSRLLYVFDLVLAHVRNWGWNFAEEFCWERTGIPQQVARRFKNQFEPVYHFTLDEWKFRPRAVMHESDAVPIARGKGAGDTNAAKRQGVISAVDGNDVAEGMAYPGNRLPKFHSEALGHSAAFPVGLPSFFIKAYTDHEDTVYEPFSGSGTTIIACEQLGRKCRAIEISPAYVAVALQRWADATGKTPKLAA